jgi:DNA (cytosine-5)-methyltransferase 1
MSVSVRDKQQIIVSLDDSLELAKSQQELNVIEHIARHLDAIFKNIDTATSGYLNLITCLICSSLNDEIDPRFHRKPGKGMPKPENPDGWFSGRTVSEKIIYPWMELKGFRTAKSGWQTRTYERPKPYTLDYPENIAIIKEPFLKTLDFATKNRSKRQSLVAYLFRKEIEYKGRKGKLVERVSKNNIGNEVLIIDIMSALERHFASPNSAHLPVIAIYSIYELLINEVDNYSVLSLRPLESHQASDLRTGSVGDIELEDLESDVIEGVEVKHGIEIDLPILLRAKEKILKSSLKRYYILTTHQSCAVINNDVLGVVRDVYATHGCQIIVNGVIPTIRYYLRMCSNPSEFINNYSKNIVTQDSVTADHLEIWKAVQDKLST